MNRNLKRIRLASDRFPAVNGGFQTNTNGTVGPFSSAVELMLPSEGPCRVRVRFRGTYMSGGSGARVLETPMAAPWSIKLAVCRFLGAYVVSAYNASDNVTLGLTNPDGSPANLEANDLVGCVITMPGRNRDANHAIKYVLSNTATQVVSAQAYNTSAVVPQIGDEVWIYSPPSAEFILGNAAAPYVGQPGEEVEAAPFVAQSGFARMQGARGPSRNPGPILIAQIDPGAGNPVPVCQYGATIGGNGAGLRIDAGTGLFPIAMPAGNVVIAFASITAEPLGDIQLVEAFGVVGDSILGALRGQMQPQPACGHARAARRAGCRFVNKTFDGAMASAIAAKIDVVAEDLSKQGVGAAFVCAGTNEALAMADVAGTLASLKTIARGLSSRGIRPIWVPLLPLTSTTDGGVSLANQTVRDVDAVRLAVNAAIDSNPGLYGFAGISDWRPILETGGKWQPNRASSGDGNNLIHPDETAYELVGARLDLSPHLPVLGA